MYRGCTFMLLYSCKHMKRFGGSMVDETLYVAKQLSMLFFVLFLKHH